MKPKNSPPKNLMPALTTAAELRAAGASWKKVGEQLGRSDETCRQWMRRYPETWRRLFHEAETHLIAEAGSEARPRKERVKGSG
jgi:transposase-like protein